MKVGSNKRYIGRVVGIVDDGTIKKARAVGIENIAGGSINKQDKRVRVFVKGIFPGADSSGGYALRSRVVWWLNTGEALHGTGANIHHKNHIRADDSFGNLEKMDHIEHAHAHNPKTVEMVDRTCKTCGNPFRIERWRLREISRGQYCSQRCYQRSERNDHFRKAISIGNKKAYAEGRRVPVDNSGEKSGMAKLTWKIVEAIRASDESGVKLAQRYRVTPTTIGDIRKRKTWNR